MLLIKNLLEQSVEVVEVTIGYFEELPKDFINSKGKISALIDFCSMKKSVSTEQPDIGLFMQ